MRKFYGEQCTATVGRSAVADRDGVKVSAVVGIAMVAATVGRLSWIGRQRSAVPMVGVVRRSRSGSVGDGRAVVLNWSATVGDGRRCQVLPRFGSVGDGWRLRWSALSGAAGVAVGIGTA